MKRLTVESAIAYDVRFYNLPKQPVTADLIATNPIVCLPEVMIGSSDFCNTGCIVTVLISPDHLQSFSRTCVSFKAEYFRNSHQPNTARIHIIVSFSAASILSRTPLNLHHELENWFMINSRSSSWNNIGRLSTFGNAAKLSLCCRRVVAGHNLLRRRLCPSTWMPDTLSQAAPKLDASAAAIMKREPHDHPPHNPRRFL